jgi:hypothetical protein
MCPEPCPDRHVEDHAPCANQQNVLYIYGGYWFGPGRRKAVGRATLLPTYIRTRARCMMTLSCAWHALHIVRPFRQHPALAPSTRATNRRAKLAPQIELWFLRTAAQIDGDPARKNQPENITACRNSCGLSSSPHRDPTSPRKRHTRCAHCLRRQRQDRQYVSPSPPGARHSRPGMDRPPQVAARLGRSILFWRLRRRMASRFGGGDAVRARRPVVGGHSSRPVRVCTYSASSAMRWY